MKHKILKKFRNKEYVLVEEIDGGKILKLSKGAYVKDITTNLVYRTAYVYYTCNNTSNVVDKSFRLCCMVSHPHVSIEIKKLKIISKKEFYKSKNIKKLLKYLENNYFKMDNEIRNLNSLNKMKDKAIEELKEKGKLDTSSCNHGPCYKSELGQCDRECDYPGA